VADERHLRTDIRLALKDARLRPVYVAGERETRTPQRPGRQLDFDVIDGRSNLAQAIFVRLLTPRGELAPLGHPEYGARLHELVGRTNTETTRNLVKLFILEALQQEPRITQKVDVTVTPAETDPPKVGAGARDVTRASRVNVELIVRPVGAPTEPLTIGPFTLELGP
jgi:phage baseplate assembly protein W